jgi:X-Pro dipeptidyl-peptidase
MVDAMNCSAIAALAAALVVAGVPAASATAKPGIETSGGLTRHIFS